MFSRPQTSEPPSPSSPRNPSINNNPRPRQDSGDNGEKILFPFSPSPVAANHNAARFVNVPLADEPRPSLLDAEKQETPLVTMARHNSTVRHYLSSAGWWKTEY
jgi:hypothetical protein